MSKKMESKIKGFKIAIILVLMLVCAFIYATWVISEMV